MLLKQRQVAARYKGRFTEVNAHCIIVVFQLLLIVLRVTVTVDFKLIDKLYFEGTALHSPLLLYYTLCMLSLLSYILHKLVNSPENCHIMFSATAYTVH